MAVTWEQIKALRRKYIELSEAADKAYQAWSDAVDQHFAEQDAEREKAREA